MNKLNPPPSGLVSPTVTTPEGSQLRPTPGLTDLKQVKAIRGVTSESLSLPIAILFAMIASCLFVKAWLHGKPADLIIVAICAFFYCFFLCGWLNYRRNQCVMLYNDELMVFQENPNSIFVTRFKSLRMIHQDLRGYTLTLDLGDQFRLLRRDMQPDLQHILDAHQHRLKCEDLISQAQSSAA